MDSGSVSENSGAVPLRIVLFGIMLPGSLALLLIAALYLTLNWSEFRAMGGFMLAYLVPPMGKESVIPLAIAWGLDWRLVAFSVGSIDVFLALFMVWNFDLAKKIPLLGAWIVRFERSGGELLDRRGWMRDLAFVGIVAFVVVPFEGSGGLAASILGRVIGMNRYKVLAAVTIGAYGGCYLIAAFSNEFLGFFSFTVTTILGIVALVLIILILFNIYRHMKRRRQGAGKESLKT